MQAFSGLGNLRAAAKVYVLFWCDAEVVQLSSEWHTLLRRQSVYIMA